MTATQPSPPTIIRFSSTWWIYMIARGGILRAIVNGTEDALAITGRNLLLIYLIYCGAKAGAFLVAPDTVFPMWLEMLMFVLQLGGLEGSIPGLARQIRVLEEQHNRETAEKIKKTMLSARVLTVASMAEGALHSLQIVDHATMQYISAGLLVIRGVVITGFLIELAKIETDGPRVLSRAEHAREEEQDRENGEQAQTIADLRNQLESGQEEMEHLHEQLEMGQQMVSSLRVQLNNSVSSVQSEVDSEVSSLRVQLNSTIAELDTERKKVSSVQLQLDSRIAELDTLCVQLDSRDQQLTSMKETMASGMKWHESNTEMAVSSVQLQLDRERDRVSSLQEHLSSAIAELDRERQKVSSVQLTVSSVQLQMDGEVSRLTAEVDSLRVQLDEERKKVSHAEALVNTLHIQLHTEQQEMESLRVQVKRYEESRQLDSGPSDIDTRVIRLDNRTRKNGLDENAIGEQIRDLLKAEPGLSGRTIAARIGCSPTTATKWKNSIEKEVSDECANA